MIVGSLQVKMFTRPTQRTWGKLNRGLGPVPPNMPDLRKRKDIDWDVIPQYSRLVVMAVIGCVAFIAIGLMYAFDWMSHSVVTASLLLLPISDDARQQIAAVIIQGYLLLLIWRLRDNDGGGGGGKSRKPQGLLRAAIFEEQWFRSGCESWPTSKRVYSCILFGTVHLWNLVVPVAAVVALMFGGAVMMAVYLRAYRASGDITFATLTSSRFHCDYNKMVLCVVLPAVLVATAAYAIFRAF